MNGIANDEMRLYWFAARLSEDFMHEDSALDGPATQLKELYNTFIDQLYSGAKMLTFNNSEPFFRANSRIVPRGDYTVPSNMFIVFSWGAITFTTNLL